MAIDFAAYAQNLKITDVWRRGNSTGIVTDKRLYTPPQAPEWERAKGGLLHGTVGTNSLRYLAGGSIADGRWVSAQYLFPKEPYTVYKLVPDGFACNHAGPARWRGVTNLNECFYGFEIENRQDGADPFTAHQYIKTALVWAYLSARDSLLDLDLTTHAQVAIPAGRRSDPIPAGNFDLALFYGILQDIRRESRVWQLWEMRPWFGGKPAELEV